MMRDRRLAVCALAFVLSACAARTEREAAVHEEEAHDEGVVTLTRAAVRNGGIEVGPAGPGEVVDIISAPGEVRLNGERTVDVRPRYPGVLRSVTKHLGQNVRAGEALAVVHGSESLTDYTVTAPLTGTIVARDVAAGQVVDAEDVLCRVTDLRTLWIEIAVYPQYLGRIAVGQSVHVVAHGNGGPEVRGRIDYLGPLLEQDTRTTFARVTLDNARGAWLPGMFVTADIDVERTHALVSVPEEALVRTPQGDAAFRATSDTTFALTHLRVGRRDGRTAEVLDGLQAGDRIVMRGAFVLKSELGKGEAEHDH